MPNPIFQKKTAHRPRKSVRRVSHVKNQGMRLFCTFLRERRRVSVSQFVQVQGGVIGCRKKRGEICGQVPRDASCSWEGTEGWMEHPGPAHSMHTHTPLLLIKETGGGGGGAPFSHIPPQERELGLGRIYLSELGLISEPLSLSFAPPLLRNQNGTGPRGRTGRGA